ncbi:HugZ family protein [Brucellaceae bacterium C25G]
MENTPEKTKEIIRPTTPQAIELVKTFLRTARFGALACINADSGRPNASRVALATDYDGTPLILVSALAAHTPALLSNPYCSLLIGEPGKGDAMAYARTTIHCKAVQIKRDHPTYSNLRTRYLNHNPKGALYVDLGDFSFFRLEIDGASLNGGFGKAFNLTREDLVCDPQISASIAVHETETIEFLNQNYKDKIRDFAHQTFKPSSANQTWTLSAVDTDGFNIRSNESVERVWFKEKLINSDDSKKQIISAIENT